MPGRGLADMHLADLHARAAGLGVDGYRKLARPALIEAIEAASPQDTEDDADVAMDVAVSAADVAAPVGPDSADSSEADRGEESAPEPVRGVLELTHQGYGFVRLRGLGPEPEDVYISASQVRRCELRPGDEVSGPARGPRRGERHRALVHVDAVNGAEPLAGERPEFDALPAVPTDRRVPLDSEPGDVLARSVDLLAPLALGQRALVRAAPRSGRTTLLRGVARAAQAAGDTVRVVVLLIDERPEEAMPWREAVPTAEFAIATAELAPGEQAQVAELALERARRLAERGLDAVLVCDSLSRLAFATGDAAKVKRLFGSGRNLAGAGSLTVIATVLASHDDGAAERAVITTESALITLDSELAAAGVFPALTVEECRVSNEEQLRSPEELEAARRLRSMLADLGPTEAVNMLRERIEATVSNADLLGSLGRRLL